MIFTLKKISILVATSLLLFVEVSHAAPANELNAVIVTPFTFATDAAPQNVLDEMSIEIDLPLLTLDFFQENNIFKSTSFAEENTEAEVEADLYIKGEIIHVSGGNAAARYWGGLSGAGRSEMAISIKVYDKNDQLIREGLAIQNGARSGGIAVFSNKKNLITAMKAITSKISLVALAGDIATSEGVVLAMESNFSLAIRAAARSSSKHELFLDEAATDSMAAVLLKTLEGDISDKYYLDGAAWCAINLGKSQNKKYISTLETVVASNASNKIKKHAKKALGQLKKLKG